MPERLTESEAHDLPADAARGELPQPLGAVSAPPSQDDLPEKYVAPLLTDTTELQPAPTRTLSPRRLGYDYHALATYLSKLGYVVFTSEWYPVVEYGKRHRWRSMLRYPVPLADTRAWGNLVAIDPALAETVQAPKFAIRRSASLE